VWEPLIMVADLVGDEWAQRARNACVAFRLYLLARRGYSRRAARPNARVLVSPR
jgi:hypothetical protein